jgi:sensor c-di-GMP phosphodiesterase-like protein
LPGEGAENFQVSSFDAALLRRVLAPGAITAFKQPVVRLRDGEVIGWEALARTAAAPHVPPLAWL